MEDGPVYNNVYLKMKKVRIIPRLDVKGPNIVKGIQLEGLRVIGKPAELARRYYEQGADEILYIDIVASLYERNNLTEVVKETISKGVFIPLTVGGGIRSIEDIKKILRAGADKVAINTAATRNPELITKAAKIFGSQCIVGSIEAKKVSDKKWESYIDNGREKTGLDVIEWAKKLERLGVGEILITSVDRDGTRYGFDEELIKKVVDTVNVPVIACGGAKNEKNIVECFKNTQVDGISCASILHYNESTIEKIKYNLEKNKINIRKITDIININNKDKNKKVVSIVDYGVGNLMSVIFAFKNLGNKVKIISTKKEVEKAELLVLPGDGAFGFGMDQLRKRRLIDSIYNYVKEKKPFLGICLGMQLLMTESYEFGHHEGLNLIEGSVVPFEPVNKVKKKDYKIPHIGWNQLKKPKKISWKNTILNDIKDNSESYFVHSFKIMPKNKKNILAITEYGNQSFCSVITKDNIYGTQFHPEKSGKVGMDILSYFSNL